MQLFSRLQGLPVFDRHAICRLRPQVHYQVRSVALLPTLCLLCLRFFCFFAILVIITCSGENVAGRALEDFDQVKPILEALLKSVLNLHLAGVVHADLKPRNIMRTGGINSFFYRFRGCKRVYHMLPTKSLSACHRLIDFDASACLPPPAGPEPPPKFCTRFVGSKSSSM